MTENTKEVPMDEIRYCNCADPENCKTPIPGYACRPRKSAPSIAGKTQEGLVEVPVLLLERVVEALQRALDDRAPRRIPVDWADADILQHEIKTLIGPPSRTAQALPTTPEQPPLKWRADENRQR